MEERYYYVPNKQVCSFYFLKINQLQSSLDPVGFINIAQEKVWEYI